MKSRTQRKLFMVLVLAGLSVAGFLTYRALQENLLYFFSPSQVASPSCKRKSALADRNSYAHTCV